MKGLMISGLIMWASLSWSQDVDPCMYWGGEGPCPFEQKTICGITDNKKVLFENQNIGISISVLSDHSGYHETLHVLASSDESKNFLRIVGVHGAAICNPLWPADAPFEICYDQDQQSGFSSSIRCGKNECLGPNCGGNGFSVNSGDS